MNLLILAIYGLFVGIIVRFLYPGKQFEGILPTMFLGILGSYTGGFINYLLGNSSQIVSLSGFLMSIVGGLIFCLIYFKLFK